MEHDFWHNKWASNEIGFHDDEVNASLQEYLPKLNLTSNARVFLPLCGKTLDIGWLLSQGYRVVGAELSELAITQLFNSLQLTPNILQFERFKRYQAANLDVLVGDIFALSAEDLGGVDAIFDRAALVALPAPMRVNYTRQLIALTAAAPQLLVTFEYQQSRLEGPPFAVAESEVEQHYQQQYRLQSLSKKPLNEGFKGLTPFNVHTWLLTPRSL